MQEDNPRVSLRVQVHLFYLSLPTPDRDGSRSHRSIMDTSGLSHQWRIGDTLVTSVVEQTFDWSSPSFLFPDATNELVQRHGWLVPDMPIPMGILTGQCKLW